MSTPVSPLAPAGFPALPPVTGVRFATGNSGIRYQGRDDLLLVLLPPETVAAGVLTRSLTASAPVHWCRRGLEAGGGARAVVVNAGNANAFTGKAGDATVAATVAAAQDLAGAIGGPVVRPEDVYIASTGVIGEPLAADVIARALPPLAGRLHNQHQTQAQDWEAAARAIMTTDTFPKGATRRTEIDGVPVTLNGIAKGSGMIAPDMATMLVFLFTDAAIAQPVLQGLVADSNARTFNCITVDGDTSTSDTVLLFATGQAGHTRVTEAADSRLSGFRAALEELMCDLAHQVVRDGEGASKFITVRVAGAENDAAARRIALSIANSPLVKTAIAGEDANWGRVVMAIGKAGEKAERDRLRIMIGGYLVCADGMRAPNYDEGPVAAYMKGQNIAIDVELGVGAGLARVWTCDLTHGYIDINGSYRS